MVIQEALRGGDRRQIASVFDRRHDQSIRKYKSQVQAPKGELLLPLPLCRVQVEPRLPQGNDKWLKMSGSGVQPSWMPQPLFEATKRDVAHAIPEKACQQRGRLCLSGRPHRVEELADFELEAVTLAG